MQVVGGSEAYFADWADTMGDQRLMDLALGEVGLALLELVHLGDWGGSSI